MILLWPSVFACSRQTCTPQTTTHPLEPYISNMQNQNNLNEIDLASTRHRFGLSELTFIPDPDTAPTGQTPEDAESDIASALQQICEALELPESELGRVWRESENDAATLPALNIQLHATAANGEEGHYNPTTGQLALIGSTNPLPHEMGHVIDFRLGCDGAPWSWGLEWRDAVLEAPEFRFAARVLDSRLPYRQRYHTTPHELFARAFECFVLDGAAAPGAAPVLEHQNGYPCNEERTILNDAITKLVVSRLQKRS